MQHMIFRGRQVDQILILATAYTQERRLRTWAEALRRELGADPSRVDRTPTWPAPPVVGGHLVSRGDLLRASLDFLNRFAPWGEDMNALATPGPVPPALRNPYVTDDEGFRLHEGREGDSLVLALEWGEADDR